MQRLPDNQNFVPEIKSGDGFVSYKFTDKYGNIEFVGGHIIHAMKTDGMVVITLVDMTTGDQFVYYWQVNTPDMKSRVCGADGIRQSHDASCIIIRNHSYGCVEYMLLNLKDKSVSTDTDYNYEKYWSDSYVPIRNDMQVLCNSSNILRFTLANGNEYTLKLHHASQESLEICRDEVVISQEIFKNFCVCKLYDGYNIVLVDSESVMVYRMNPPPRVKSAKKLKD